MWLQQEYLGNTLEAWMTAAGIAVAVLLVLRILQYVVTRKFAHLADKTSTEIDDLIVGVLKKTKLLFLSIFSLHIGLRSVVIPERAEQISETIFVIALLLQIGVWGSATILFWLNRIVRKRMAEDASSATTMTVLGFVSRLALWSVVLLIALDSVGVNITGLATGLGIGGVAVALALQSILGDIFASLSIALDKPFVIGDFIIVGEFLGTVEHIGLKTTRLRSLSGEQLVFSNTDLLKSRIRNYKRMFERRVLFSVGITYETPLDKVERVSGMIANIVQAQPKARFDRSHFKEFGDSAFVFEVVYYVKSPDFNVYMDIQQSINLDIARRFQSEGIEFAYPTRTLHVQYGEGENKPADAAASKKGQPS